MPNWLLNAIKFLRSLSINPWFQLIAGIASIVGLAITFWTFIRAGKVQSAIRNLQLETNNKSFYTKKIQNALSFFEGLKQSVEEYQSSNSVKVSTIDGINQLEGHIVLLRKSIEQEYPWFKDQAGRKKAKSINNLNSILVNVEQIAQKDLITKQEIHTFLKQIAELVVIIGRELKDE